MTITPETDRPRKPIVVPYDWLVPASLRTALVDDRDPWEESYFDTINAVLSGRRTQLAGCAEGDSVYVRLYLPVGLKQDWDAAAAQESLDTNAWLCREVFGVLPLHYRHRRSGEARIIRFRLYGAERAAFETVKADDEGLSVVSDHRAARILFERGLHTSADSDRALASDNPADGLPLRVVFVVDHDARTAFNTIHALDADLCRLTEHQAAREITLRAVYAAVGNG